MPPGRYQLQAAINAVHTYARDIRDTDWEQLGTLYDQLYTVNPSPVVALNRAIVIAELDGAAVALAEVDRLELAITTPGTPRGLICCGVWAARPTRGRPTTPRSTWRSIRQRSATSEGAGRAWLARERIDDPQQIGHLRERPDDDQLESPAILVVDRLDAQRGAPCPPAERRSGQRALEPLDALASIPSSWTTLETSAAAPERPPARFASRPPAAPAPRGPTRREGLQIGPGDPVLLADPYAGQPPLAHVVANRAHLQPKDLGCLLGGIELLSHR